MALQATGYGVICTIEELIDCGYTWREIHHLFEESESADAAVRRGLEYIARAYQEAEDSK